MNAEDALRIASNTEENQEKTRLVLEKILEYSKRGMVKMPILVADCPGAVRANLKNLGYSCKLYDRNRTVIISWE